MEPPPIHGGELVAEDDDGVAGFAIIKDCEIDAPLHAPARVGPRRRPRAARSPPRTRCAPAPLRRGVAVDRGAQRQRPRRIYQASGWRKTKELRERVWNGTPLRELRYRKRLELAP